MKKTYCVVDEWGNVVARNIPTLADAEQTISELYGEMRAAGVTDECDFPDYEIHIEWRR